MVPVRQNPDTQVIARISNRKAWNNLQVLFLALVPMVIIVPVLPSDPSSRPFVLIFLTLLFVTGIYGMRGNRRRFLFSCILALISIETFWVSVWPGASSLSAWRIFLLLFLGHQARHLLQELVVFEGGIMDIISRTLPWL